MAERIALKRIVRICPHPLTEDEQREKGLELAQANAAAEDLEAEKKADAESYKERIAYQQARARRLSRTLNDGFEERPTECEQMLNVITGMVEIIRCDTAEIVETRVATADERQARMPF